MNRIGGRAIEKKEVAMRSTTDHFSADAKVLSFAFTEYEAHLEFIVDQSMENTVFP